VSPRKKVIDTPDPAVAWAEKLWADLRTGLLNVEKSIAQIIHDKAWEPLGYNSFTEAWAAQVTDITIAAELRAHVVYQMYREGATPEDVAAAVKYVSRDQAEQFKREMDNGVPAEIASGRKKPKGEPLPFVTVFVPVPRETHRAWTRVARNNDTTLAQIALRALETAMGELE
jgi:hypothetical protein